MGDIPTFGRYKANLAIMSANRLTRDFKKRTISTDKIKAAQ